MPTERMCGATGVSTATVIVPNVRSGQGVSSGSNGLVARITTVRGVVPAIAGTHTSVSNPRKTSGQL